MMGEVTMVLSKLIILALPGLVRGSRCWTTRPSVFPVVSAIKSRGGNSDDGALHDESDGRYSRQVYTLGAKAHSRIRSSKVFLDGPAQSGLMFEIGKNLVLSGIGSLVIVMGSEPNQAHAECFDDLSLIYHHGARAELEDISQGSDVDVLVGYLRQLNPSVNVSMVARENLSPSEKEGVLVLVDHLHTEQEKLSHVARESSLSFVAVECNGVFGKLFCDFGDCHEIYDSDGEPVVDVPLARIVIENDGIANLYCVEGEKHDVSEGDTIEFLVPPLSNFTSGFFEVIQVVASTHLRAKMKGDGLSKASVATIAEVATGFRRVKQAETMSFDPMTQVYAKTNIDDSLFALCDLVKTSENYRRDAILSCFRALDMFICSRKRYPCHKDEEAFALLVSEAAEGANLKKDEDWRNLVKSFVSTCKAKLPPIQALMGALAAQETLKALTGLYRPVHQFLLFDCEEILPEESQSRNPDQTWRSGMEYILGSSVVNQLGLIRPFIIGTGAIGCELLKNLCAMQVRKVIITDMDIIEESNLSRQLLFRDHDLGKFKAVAAAEAAMRLNPSLSVDLYTDKVGSGESPFTDNFWSRRVDIVLNALDNVETRLYVDDQCVGHRVPMIDAGTLGAKGNVQVVIPFQSESYGSSVDPPEAAIPVCTLKTFPYAIAHTIQWARDLFIEFFETYPEQASHSVAGTSLENADNELDKLATSEVQVESALLANGVSGTIRKYALSWAVRKARTLFHENISRLLEEHPEGSLDDDGSPFWTGSRRMPQPLWYSTDANHDFATVVNDNIVRFVQYAAKLKLDTMIATNTFGVPERSEAVEFLSSVQLEHPILDDAGIAAEDRPHKNQSSWTAQSFEKDDETNGHVAFVAAASNLRALAYGISPTDEAETRRIAGRIVPAMITTTAAVSALASMEFIKLVQRKPLGAHRNAFINLGVPFLAFASPLPSETHTSLYGSSFTIWDRVMIDDATGGMDLDQFLKQTLTEMKVDPKLAEISSVSYGPYLVYASFLHKNNHGLLSKTLWSLVEEAIEEDSNGDGSTRFTEKNFLDLTITVEDRCSMQEFDIPPVRLRNRSGVCRQLGESKHQSVT